MLAISNLMNVSNEGNMVYMFPGYRAKEIKWYLLRNGWSRFYRKRNTSS
jgi:hypothetical protein